MKPLRVVPQVDDELHEIWSYLLGQAGLDVANRVQSKLYSAFWGLAELPGKGHRRSDLTLANVLFFNVYEYLIVYRRLEYVEIVAVLHHKRDAKRLLKARRLF